jgi:hypothetical protein
MTPIHPALLTDPALHPDPAKLIRLLNGKVVDSKTIRDTATVLACGTQLPSSNAIYGFKTDADFQAFCDRLPIGDSVHRAYRDVSHLQSLEKGDLSKMETSTRAAVDAQAAELKRLAQQEGVAENSRELFHLVTGASPSNPTPRLLGFTVLYENVGFGGKLRPTPLTIPKLKWIGLDNQVSSIRGFGAGFLAADTFFRGKKFFYFGIPEIEFEDLRLFDYDNVASSLYIFG